MFSFEESFDKVHSITVRNAFFKKSMAPDIVLCEIAIDCLLTRLIHRLPGQRLSDRSGSDQR